MTPSNAILWVDRDESFVFHFHSEECHGPVVLRVREGYELSQAKQGDAGIAFDKDQYFKSIERSLGDTVRIVISGPASTRFEFANYLGMYQEALCGRVIAIERVALADDEDMIKLAEKYFKNQIAVADHLVGAG